MRHSERPGTTADLSEPVHQQLNMYALAASAAGVSLLSLTQPAEAKIIYTPTHVVISPNGVHLYNLDLNHDGTDFVLQTKFYSTTNHSAGTQVLIASGVQGNSLDVSHGFAAALEAGKVVGPRKNFQNRGVMASDSGSAGASTSVKRGPWVDVGNRYLGLKFKINGETHYGWARLSVKAQRGYFYVEATLTGFAYETVANKPIMTGKTKGPDDVEQSDPGPGASLTNPIPDALEPAALGALAMGAPGLPLWRKETVAKTIEQKGFSEDICFCQRHAVSPATLLSLESAILPAT